MNDKADNDVYKTPSYVWIFGLVAFLVFLVGSVLPLQFEYPVKPGEFGDMFGLANALMSMLALIGVVIAISMQRYELRLQQKELSDTREVLKLQADQLKDQSKHFDEQNELMVSQRREETFFQLIRNLHEIADTVTRNPQSVEGRQLFSEVFNGQEAHLGSNFGESRKINELSLNVFNHFAKNVQLMCEWVIQDTSPQKKLYLRLMNAQFTDSQLGILAMMAMYRGGDLRDCFYETGILHGAPETVQKYGIEKGELGIAAFSNETWGDD